MNKVELPVYAKIAFTFITILSVGYLAILGHEILSPLIFSFLFSVLLLPLCGFFERRLGFGRGIASLVSVLLLVLSIFLLIYLIGSQLTDLTKDWPLLKSQLSEAVKSTHVWVEKQFHIDMKNQAEYIDNATDKLLNSSTAVIGATLLSLSSIFLFLIFVMIYTFFLLFHRALLLRFIVALCTQEHSAVVLDIAENIKLMIKQYIRGLLLEMLIVATISCVVFFIIGIKYAFLLGLITGIFNLIPYVGIFTALLITTLITFATSVGLKAIIVAAAIIIIHLIDSNYVMPKIVGSKVQLNPLVVVVGVVLGEMMWGISGMFLSIPVIAMMKIIFDRIDGLQPWGILLGDEEYQAKRVKKATRLPKKNK